MKIYIQSATAISPQKTFGQASLLIDPVSYSSNRLQNIEPDYKSLIDVKLLRRMSRMIKMGVATAAACLQEAGEQNPGAIITGTAYGCLEDTGIFLTETIQRNEELPPPTPFIQSTHNTIGAQIALMLNCHNYNNTFVHNGFSFESALLDAMLLLKEKEAHNVLVGSADELTDTSYTILNRLGLYKHNPVSNINLFALRTKGTIAGEGVAFFLLSNKRSSGMYAQLNGMTTFYKPKSNFAIEQQISSFLATQAIDVNEIDLIITGKNGDDRQDHIYEQLQQTIFAGKQTIHFKHLCGEYPTASSFALWLSANILKTGIIPAFTGHVRSTEDTCKRILIYNHYQFSYHSLLLVSAVV